MFRNFALVTQLGISMMTPVFLMLAVGILIDRHTGFAATLPFMILGFAAGIRNVVALLRKALADGGNRDRMEALKEEKKLVDEAVRQRNKTE